MKVRPSKLPLLLPSVAFEVLTSGNAGWLTVGRVKGRRIPGPHIIEVPTLDYTDEDLEKLAETGVYPDWTPENSEIVRSHWTTFNSKDEAMEYFETQYGHVYQDLSTAKWWAARVPKKEAK